MKKVEEALKNYYENGFEWLDEEEYNLLNDYIYDNQKEVETLYRGLHIDIERLEEEGFIEPNDEEPFASSTTDLNYASDFGNTILVFKNEKAFKMPDEYHNEYLIENLGAYEVEEIENVNGGEYYLVHLK